MIMTVDELKRYIDTDEEVQVLEAKLQALELQIRGYTSNNFTLRHWGRLADIAGGKFEMDDAVPYEAGDTVQVSGMRNVGLYTVKEVINDTTFTVNEKVYDDIDAYVVKVDYPMDVKMGAVNLMQYELTSRDKAGIASETISRHSVTYADQSAENNAMGYPMALLGFLQPYMKARFGRGVRA